MTFNITTVVITTFGIMTLSMTILSKAIKHDIR